MNGQFLNQALHVLRRYPQDVRVIASNFVSSHLHAIPWLLFRVLIHLSLHRLEACTPWLIVYGFGSVANTKRTEVGEGSSGSREAEGKGGEDFYIAQSGSRLDFTRIFWGEFDADF